jgi:hypothetical protein
VTPDYPYIPKTLDTITPISAVMGGCLIDSINVYCWLELLSSRALTCCRYVSNAVRPVLVRAYVVRGRLSAKVFSIVTYPAASRRAMCDEMLPAVRPVRRERKTKSASSTTYRFDMRTSLAGSWISRSKSSSCDSPSASPPARVMVDLRQGCFG